VRTRSRSPRIAPAVVVAGLLAALLPVPAGWAQAVLQETPAAAAAEAVPAGAQVLCGPQVIGQRHIPKDSILARMASHQGDPYDPDTVERDFNSIWNTGYFERVWIERVDEPASADSSACVQLVVHVVEKPTIRTIDYQGLNAVTVSDVDERFKKAKVGLVPESQFDYTRVMRAEAC
jgi:outer membrane protein insertion porin family